MAASLQAVTLFTVAEDPTSCSCWVNVDEADVGAVREGQKASFTVSAYPSAPIPGAHHPRGLWLHQDRQRGDLHPAWMQVDNADLSLRPGMTAAATITATERNDVLLVPNTAPAFHAGRAAGAGKPASAQGGAASSRN